MMMVTSISAFADKLSVCNKFKADVLIAAVHDEEKDEKHPVRFEKDEKKAAAFLNQFQLSLLDLQDRLRYVPLKGKGCTDWTVTDPTCDTAFAAYHFFRGLIHGMKNYGWSDKTVQLGRKKFGEFIRASVTPGLPFLDLLFAYTLMIDFKETFPSSNIDGVKLKSQKVELDKAIAKYTAEVKDFKRRDCPEKEKRNFRESRVALKYQQTFVDLLNKSEF